MSKVIDSGSLEGIKPWHMPDLDEGEGNAITRKRTLQSKHQAQSKSTRGSDSRQESEQVNLLTAEKIAEIQAQAHREGFEQGREEGRKAGLADMQSKAKQLELLMARLARPFEELDAQVEQELLALVVALTRLLLQREIEIDSRHILHIVRETLEALPVAARDVKLYLHPDDAVLVREAFSQTEEERLWKLVDDHLLGRGDCRVVSDTSQIDATLETRLKMLFGTALDSESEQES